MTTSRLIPHPVVAGVAMALAVSVGTAAAQITPVSQFTGEYSDGFETGTLSSFGLPRTCMLPPEIFGGQATLCTYSATSGALVSGVVHWGSGVVNSCTINANQGSRFVINSNGRFGFIFNVSVGRFGGFFGSNQSTTVNGGGTVEFYDEFDLLVGTEFLDLGPCGNSGWKWHGWESTVPIRRIMVYGAESSGARVAMDAMEFDVFVGGPLCYANCNQNTTEPILTVDDFTCFINEFASAQGLPHEQQLDHYANCDGSTSAPVLTVDDFTCFVNAFAAGCP